MHYFFISLFLAFNVWLYADGTHPEPPLTETPTQTRSPGKVGILCKCGGSSKFNEVTAKPSADELRQALDKCYEISKTPKKDTHNCEWKRTFSFACLTTNGASSIPVSFQVDSQMTALEDLNHLIRQQQDSSQFKVWGCKRGDHSVINTQLKEQIGSNTYCQSELTRLCPKYTGYPNLRGGSYSSIGNPVHCLADTDCPSQLGFK